MLSRLARANAGQVLEECDAPIDQCPASIIARVKSCIPGERITLNAVARKGRHLQITMQQKLRSK